MTKPAATLSNPSLEKVKAQFSRACGGPRFFEKDVIFEGTKRRNY
jgi:hypothetical protein